MALYCYYSFSGILREIDVNVIVHYSLLISLREKNSKERQLSRKIDINQYKKEAKKRTKEIKTSAGSNRAKNSTF